MSRDLKLSGVEDSKSSTNETDVRHLHTSRGSSRENGHQHISVHRGDRPRGNGHQHTSMAITLAVGQRYFSET